MLNSFYPLKYVILKPHDLCVILSASSELMICLAFLDVNLVTDKKLILPFFNRKSTILFI